MQDDGLYNLSILPIVARLMGIQEEEIAEEWAVSGGVSALGIALRVVAEGVMRAWWV